MASVRTSPSNTASALRPNVKRAARGAPRGAADSPASRPTWPSPLFGASLPERYGLRSQLASLGAPRVQSYPLCWSTTSRSSSMPTRANRAARLTTILVDAAAEVGLQVNFGTSKIELMPVLVGRGARPPTAWPCCRQPAATST